MSIEIYLPKKKENIQNNKDNNPENSPLENISTDLFAGLNNQ